MSVEVKTSISVRYTAACDKCGTVNTKTTNTMEEEEFNRLRRIYPEDYWKEDQAGGVVYRHHEETSDARCKRGC